MNLRQSKITLLALCFFMIMIFSSTMPLYSQKTKIRITKVGAVLKLKPNDESLTIKELPLGSEFNVEEIMKGWIKIKLPADEDGIVITGFIHISFIELTTEQHMAEQEKEKIEAEKLTYAQLEQEAVTETKIREGPRIGIGLEFGYSSLSDKNYKGGLKYGGNINLIITKNIAIELSGLNSQSEVQENPAGLSKGKITITPIGLSIQGRFPLGKHFVPYIVGGGSYWVNKFTIDANTISPWRTLGFEIKEEVENSWGFHFGAGIDFFITKKIAINGDIRYFNVNSKGTWRLSEQITNIEVTNGLENINFSSVMIGMGLKFFF